MNNLSGALRLVVSLPIYAASILASLLTLKPLFDAGMILLAGFLTPYQIGSVLGYLLASAIMTTIAAGLWMLARYVRTSRFRKQPAPVANPLP